MEENLIGSWEGCKNGLDEGRTDVGWDAAWGGGRYAEKRMATLFFWRGKEEPIDKVPVPT